MDDFNFNLRTAEEHPDKDDAEDDVVLGVLNGSALSEEWVQSVTHGDVLFLAVEGDLDKLASGFTHDIKDMGGQPMHFRKFLVVSPPGMDINMDDL